MPERNLYIRVSGHLYFHPRVLSVGSLYPTSMRIAEDGRLAVNFKTEAQFHGLFVLSHPGKSCCQGAAPSHTTTCTASCPHGSPYACWLALELFISYEFTMCSYILHAWSSFICVLYWKAIAKRAFITVFLCALLLSYLISVDSSASTSLLSFFSSSMRNFWVKAEKIFILKFQIRELQLIETASAVTACALKIDKICQYVNQLISVRFTKTPWLEIVWFFFFDFPRCPAGFPCSCKVASVGLEVEAVHWLASRAWASRSWALTKEGENNWMIKKKRGPVAIC